MNKLMIVVWLVFGLYFIIASAGDSSAISTAICAAIAMFCGFMVARHMADIVKPGGNDE